eukprot:gene12362-8489_t
MRGASSLSAIPFPPPPLCLSFAMPCMAEMMVSSGYTHALSRFIMVALFFSPFFFFPFLFIPLCVSLYICIICVDYRVSHQCQFVLFVFLFVCFVFPYFNPLRKFRQTNQQQHKRRYPPPPHPIIIDQVGIEGYIILACGLWPLPPFEVRNAGKQCSKILLFVVSFFIRISCFLFLYCHEFVRNPKVLRRYRKGASVNPLCSTGSDGAGGGRPLSHSPSAASSLASTHAHRHRRDASSSSATDQDLHHPMAPVALHDVPIAASTHIQTSSPPPAGVQLHLSAVGGGTPPPQSAVAWPSFTSTNPVSSPPPSARRRDRLARSTAGQGHDVRQQGSSSRELHSLGPIVSAMDREMEEDDTYSAGNAATLALLTHCRQTRWDPDVQLVHQLVHQPPPEGPANVLLQPSSGDPILHVLLKEGRVEAVKACLTTPLTMDFTVVDLCGQTPLHCVCMKKVDDDATREMLAAILCRLGTRTTPILFPTPAAALPTTTTTPVQSSSAVAASELVGPDRSSTSILSPHPQQPSGGLRHAASSTALMSLVEHGGSFRPAALPRSARSVGPTGTSSSSSSPFGGNGAPPPSPAPDRLSWQQRDHLGLDFFDAAAENQKLSVIFPVLISHGVYGPKSLFPPSPVDKQQQQLSSAVRPPTAGRRRQDSSAGIPPPPPAFNGSAAPPPSVTAILFQNSHRFLANSSGNAAVRDVAAASAPSIPTTVSGGGTLSDSSTSRGGGSRPVGAPGAAAAAAAAAWGAGGGVSFAGASATGVEAKGAGPLPLRYTPPPPPSIQLRTRLWLWDWERLRTAGAAAPPLDLNTTTTPLLSRGTSVEDSVGDDSAIGIQPPPPMVWLAVEEEPNCSTSGASGSVPGAGVAFNPQLLFQLSRPEVIEVSTATAMLCKLAWEDNFDPERIRQCIQMGEREEQEQRIGATMEEAAERVPAAGASSLTSAPGDPCRSMSPPAPGQVTLPPRADLMFKGPGMPHPFLLLLIKEQRLDAIRACLESYPHPISYTTFTTIATNNYRGGARPSGPAAHGGIDFTPFRIPGLEGKQPQQPSSLVTLSNPNPEAPLSDLAEPSDMAPEVAAEILQMIVDHAKAYPADQLPWRRYAVEPMPLSARGGGSGAKHHHLVPSPHTQQQQQQQQGGGGGEIEMDFLWRAATFQKLSLFWPIVSAAPFYAALPKPLLLKGRIWSWDFNALPVEEQALFHLPDPAQQLLGADHSTAQLFALSLQPHPDPSLVEAMVAAGAKVQFVDPDTHRVPLHTFLTRGLESCVRAVFATRQPINFLQPDEDGWTPLCCVLKEASGHQGAAGRRRYRPQPSLRRPSGGGGLPSAGCFSNGKFAASYSFSGASVDQNGSVYASGAGLAASSSHGGVSGSSGVGVGSQKTTAQVSALLHLLLDRLAWSQRQARQLQQKEEKRIGSPPTGQQQQPSTGSHDEAEAAARGNGVLDPLAQPFNEKAADWGSFAAETQQLLRWRQHTVLLEHTTVPPSRSCVSAAVVASLNSVSRSGVGEASVSHTTAGGVSPERHAVHFFSLAAQMSRLAVVWDTLRQHSASRAYFALYVQHGAGAGTPAPPRPLPQQGQMQGQVCAKNNNNNNNSSSSSNRPKEEVWRGPQPLPPFLLSSPDDSVTLSQAGFAAHHHRRTLSSDPSGLLLLPQQDEDENDDDEEEEEEEGQAAAAAAAAHGPPEEDWHIPITVRVRRWDWEQLGAADQKELLGRVQKLSGHDSLKICFSSFSSSSSSFDWAIFIYLFIYFGCFFFRVFYNSVPCIYAHAARIHSDEINLDIIRHANVEIRATTLLYRTLYFYRRNDTSAIWDVSKEERERKREKKRCMALPSRLLHYSSYLSLFASFHVVLYYSSASPLAIGHFIPFNPLNS